MISSHSSDTPWSFHGPAASDVFVILGPGDRGRLEDVAPTLIADGLAQAGLRVLRFPAPADAGSADEGVDARLAERFLQAVAHRPPRARLVLAGFSRGARVGAALVTELQAHALLAFAYPFHPRDAQAPSGALELLRSLPVPALICQGTRDSHGNREQVRGYGLASHVRVHWMEDANHALVPRAASGHTQAGQCAQAASVAAAFIRSLG